MQKNQTNLIEIVVNGQPREVAAGLNVTGLLQALGVDGGRVAVELNREIVRKGEWEAKVVEPGAKIEIVQFVGGGISVMTPRRTDHAAD